MAPCSRRLLPQSEQRVKEFEDYAVKQNLVTLRNRVNELGVAEPLVQRQGRNRIVVELPGVQDTAEAKKILGKAANLEFRMEAEPGASRFSTEEYTFRNNEFLNASVSASDSDVLYGIGAVYSVTETVDVRLEWEHIDLADEIGLPVTPLSTCSRTRSTPAFRYRPESAVSKLHNISGGSLSSQPRR